MVSEKPITLLDLPVRPHHRDGCTDYIVDAYLSERQSVNKDNIKAFVERWKNLWLLTEKDQKRHKSIDDLINGNYDVDEVLRLLNLKNDDKGLQSESENPNFSIALNLILPPCFIDVYFISKKYDVGTDLVFVRKYLDPYPEFDNELR